MTQAFHGYPTVMSRGELLSAQRPLTWNWPCRLKLLRQLFAKVAAVAGEQVVCAALPVDAHHADDVLDLRDEQQADLLRFRGDISS